LPAEILPLAEAIPRMIAARLAVMPPRVQPEEDSAAAEAIRVERSRFAAGEELAARLDDRAARFLDPTLNETMRPIELKTAQKKIDDAALRLAGFGSPERSGAGSTSTLRATALWDGHARGELLEAAGLSPGSAAKAKNIDLYVYGSVETVSEYVLVRLNGYDVSLERTIFAWKGFCSPEDPAPLADDFALQLETWVAGRDFARLDVEVDPRSAIVLVDGKRLEGGTQGLYRFEPATLLIETASPGYAPSVVETQLALGERKTVAIKLEPALRGNASLTTDAPGASILVDSMFAGTPPLSIPLTGKREIVTVYAPGRERATAILPASGEASIDLKLSPDDGLGPVGRVAVAKDEFYRKFGWFLSSIPIATLAFGANSLYREAASRYGGQDLAPAATISALVAGAAATASAALAVNSIVGMLRYLGAAR